MRDYCDCANNTSVTLNANTYTKVADVNNKRSFWAITPLSETIGIFVNLRDAATAVDETGLYRPPLQGWEMPQSALYTGEISAICVSGTVKVTLCEYYKAQE